MQRNLTFCGISSERQSAHVEVLEGINLAKHRIPHSALLWVMHCLWQQSGFFLAAQ